jgi:hypothetical protein
MKRAALLIYQESPDISDFLLSSLIDAKSLQHLVRLFSGNVLFDKPLRLWKREVECSIMPHGALGPCLTPMQGNDFNRNTGMLRFI